MHITACQKLTPPESLKKQLPCLAAAKVRVDKARDTIRRLISGDDKRLFVIAGPCTIHDPKAAQEYAAKLKLLADKISDKIYLIMRVNFEKPRTTTGWAGLINDPDLNGTYNFEKGLLTARQTLAAINDLGMASATEFLDATIPQYLSDFVSWAAIGQRTTESATHRHMASGLSMPVGFKNATDGGIDQALHAIRQAALAQQFLGIDQDGIMSQFSTTGHHDTHLLMRGVGSKSIYSKADVSFAKAQLAEFGNKRQIMVDCSHGGGGKNYLNQPRIFLEVLKQYHSGETAILGLMVESHLVGGRQDITDKPLIYGKSVTDPCLNYADTEDLILKAYQMLHQNSEN